MNRSRHSLLGWQYAEMTDLVHPSPARLADRMPPHAFFLVSALFHYLGPSFAVLLFAHVGVLGVAWLRIASAAAIFAAWRGPWRILIDGHLRRDVVRRRHRRRARRRANLAKRRGPDNRGRRRLLADRLAMVGRRARGLARSRQRRFVRTLHRARPRHLALRRCGRRRSTGSG